MKDRLRTGMLSALLVAAAMILSLQGCVLPPPGRVIVRAPLPPLPAPPFLYVISGTYAYFVAGMDVDIFFYQGYWYRPHLGRWYLAHEYNGPWNPIVTGRVPLVLRKLPPGYRRVSPPSGRLPYNDVRNNWRTWERDRHWDRHDERKRERYEEEDRGREHDRDRDKYRDNRRDPGPQNQPPQTQEPQVRHQAPPQRAERPGQIRNEDLSGGKDRGRNVRPGQNGPSGPVRQVTQPQVKQQEKKQTRSKKQQERKKVRSREKKEDQDGASSQDGSEKGRNERGKGKGTGR